MSVSQRSQKSNPEHQRQSLRLPPAIQARRALLLSAVVLAIALQHTGTAVEPSLKARILLDFGKIVPPQLEGPMVTLAGESYALGFRAASAGPYQVTIQRDYTYNQQRQLKLDVYLPQGATAPLPTVMLIHGGAWKYFSKAAVSGYARFLASHGFAAVAVDYRLSDQASWPAQLTDLEDALRWIQQNALEIGFDPFRVAALGDSAGAHLAAMLSIEAESAAPGIAAVVAYYGVYDLPPLVSSGANAAINPINQLLGKEKELDLACRQASPLYQIHAHTPPFLLIHGLEDSVVPVGQTKTFAAALTKAGVPVETVYVKGADHLLLGLPTRIDPSLQQIDRAVLQFLHRWLAQ